MILRLVLKVVLKDKFCKLHLVVLLLFATLTACESEDPFPRCVSADNFNDSTGIIINALFKDQKDFTPNEGGEVLNKPPMQTVRWKKTPFITDGKHLAIRTVGMWTAWARNNRRYSPNEVYNKVAEDMSELSASVVAMDRICDYTKLDININGKSNSCKVIVEKDKSEYGSYSSPCWFQNGNGAYLLFKRDGDPDPNQTANIMKNPKSPMVHLAYKSPQEGDRDSVEFEQAIDSKGKPINFGEGWQVYVKILDSYYYDNAGGYGLEFISGVHIPHKRQIFEDVRKAVRDQLDKAAKQNFEGIVKNKIFKNFVFLLLTLALMISALAYILGLVEHTLPDLMERILKMALVVLLISPNSWTFFYDHLLVLFLEGTDQIIAMINSHNGMGYNVKAPFAFLDSMITDKIFSSVVWNVKMRALIVADFTAIFGIPFIIVVVITYVILCCYGLIIYLTAFIGITLLVTLLPILLVCILFSQLKSIFDTWISQMISFSLQAILIFTLISLFSSIIMDTYYRIFGFTACYNDWLKVKLCIPGIEACIMDSTIKSWTPGQRYIPKVIGVTSTFDVNDKYGENARFTFTGGGAIIKVPPGYSEEAFRYVDYPYLDPGIKIANVGSAIEELLLLRLALVSLDVNDKTMISKSVYNLVLKLDSVCSSTLTCPKWSSWFGSVTEVAAKALLKYQLDRGEITQAQYDEAMKLQSGFGGAVLGDKKYEILHALEQKKHIEAKNLIVDYMATLSLPKIDFNKENSDYELIQGIKKGYMVLWSEIFAMILSAFLIWQLRLYIQTVGASLAGGNVMSQVVGNAYQYGGGFLGIISKMPIVGPPIDRVRSFLGAYRMKVGGAIEGFADEQVKGLKKRAPIVGSAFDMINTTAKGLTGATSNEKTEMQELYKPGRLKNIRVKLGAHLAFTPDKMAKYTVGHYIKKIFGETEKGLFESAKESRASMMEKIKDLSLGVPKDEPNEHIAEKDDQGRESAQFPKLSMIQQYDLLKKGKLTITDDNLSDALRARNNLLQDIHTNAAQNRLNSARNDLKRLDKKLRKKLGDRYDQVVRRRSTTDNVDNFEEE